MSFFVMYTCIYLFALTRLDAFVRTSRKKKAEMLIGANALSAIYEYFSFGCNLFCYAYMIALTRLDAFVRTSRNNKRAAEAHEALKFCLSPSLPAEKARGLEGAITAAMKALILEKQVHTKANCGFWRIFVCSFFTQACTSEIRIRTE